MRRPVHHGIHAVTQGAVALLDAVGRPLPGGELEALRLAEVELLRGEVGGDDAVEHHPAHVLGEQAGVDGAEVGAVRLAEVGELLLAERGPQHVHVARGVLRRHVCEQRAGRRAAGLGEAPGGVREGLLLRGVVGRGVGAEEGVELGVGEAVDGRGAADAARVEPDDVVGVTHTLADDEVGRPGVVDPGPAGTPRVDDERPEALGLLPRRHLHQGQLEGVALGVVVVDGDLEGRALRSLAVGPVETLGVEARERLGARGRALRRDRDRRGGARPPDVVDDRAPAEHEGGDRGTHEGGDSAMLHGRTIGEASGDPPRGKVTNRQ